MAIHAATICFDEWPEYPNILGATWEWGIAIAKLQSGDRAWRQQVQSFATFAPDVFFNQ